MQPSSRCTSKLNSTVTLLGWKQLPQALNYYLHFLTVPIYFANPYHSWERGTNENTNGLIRQYLPKRVSMKGVTQHRCNAIALQLNIRLRKRHGYKSPVEKLLYAA